MFLKCTLSISVSVFFFIYYSLVKIYDNLQQLKVNVFFNYISYKFAQIKYKYIVVVRNFSNFKNGSIVSYQWLELLIWIYL